MTDLPTCTHYDLEWPESAFTFYSDSGSVQHGSAVVCRTGPQERPGTPTSASQLTRSRSNERSCARRNLVVLNSLTLQAR